VSDDPFGDALAARASADSGQDADPFGDALAARAKGEKVGSSGDDTGGKAKKLPTADGTYASATEGPAGFVQGVAELGAKSVLGIPHAMASGELDLGRTLRIPGMDAPGSPEPKWMDWIRPKMSANAENVASAIDSNPVLSTLGAPVKATVDAAQRNFPTTSRVAGDVLSLLPAVGSKAVDVLADVGKPASTAEEVVANTAAQQSGGAAGAAHDLSNTSAPLKQAIVDASRKTGGAVNPDALQAHLEADSHGVQLTKGQATRDPEQFTAEQNSTHSDITKRLNEQNGQMVDAIDNIRRDASPTHVANSARENGQAVLDDLKDFDEPRKQAIKEAYKSANDANVAAGKGTLKLDPKPGVEAATQALEDREELLPGPGRSILQKMRDAAENNGQIPLKQVETWKTIIADETRKADRAADGSAVKALGDLRDSVEQMSPGSDASAGVKEKFDAARMLAKQRFEDMDADPAYKAAVTDSVKKGRPSPLADTFLDDYALNRGAPKSQVDLMMSKLSDEGKGGVASHTLSAIRKSAVNANGNVLPNGYNTAMAKYADKLPSLVPPETINSLQSLGRTITNAMVEPAGGKVNYSRSGVVVRDAIQGAAEHALNAKTGGLFALGKKALNLKENAFVKDALKPGAGLDSLKESK
jgi:hypothetical protein